MPVTRSHVAVLLGALGLLAGGNGKLAAAGAEALVVRPADLCVAVAQGGSRPERRAADIFAVEVRRRTGQDLSSAATAKYRLVLTLPEKSDASWVSCP
jgi:hypothetical protein